MVNVRRFFAAAVDPPAVPAELMPAFRRFFAFHTFLHSLKLGWAFEGPLVPTAQAVLFLAALVACHRRYHQAGLAVLLLYKLWWIEIRFPLSSNHAYAEAWILLCLLILPDRSLEDGRTVASRSCLLIRLTILSVYFYSGVQKLIHGLWLNGEYVALSIFSDSDAGFWHSIKLMVGGLGTLFGDQVGPLPLDRPMGFTTVPLDLPTWIVVFFLGLGWTAVLSEVTAPALTFWHKTRRLGLPLLLATVVGIGIISLETEFMFAAVGGAVLYFTSRPDRNFNWLLAVHGVWSLAVIFLDIRIWIL